VPAICKLQISFLICCMFDLDVNMLIYCIILLSDLQQYPVRTTRRQCTVSVGGLCALLAAIKVSCRHKQFVGVGS